MHINMFQFVPIITILQYLTYGVTEGDSVSFQQLKKKKKEDVILFVNVFLYIKSFQAMRK